MFLNKVYYFFKPLIPWQVRIGLRRMRANRRRALYKDTWPIDPKSGRTPPNWPGWPQGKKFAFVLTHDVEITKGYSRVEKLMQIESKHGFRSAFNFVPERTYRLSEELRRKIVDAGFDVGVHGLKHDGKLYSSKAEFARRCERIQEYFEKWQTRGFRSPLMQHELQWMHLLQADHDESTFDTDPFEPEPDGAGTIFPYWVPGPNESGFVELPYTLPQDFALFTILQEKDIRVWKEKLDWVAERGGMALINVHPDYLAFGEKGERDEFPVAFYDDFLRYAREKYGDVFWHALPREVSDYYKTAIPPPMRNTRKKVCMIAYTSYENDGRVRRYAETLAKRGDQVEVYVLAGGPIPLGTVEMCGVTVHHIQVRELNERSKWTYAARLLRFLWATMRIVAKRHKEVRYDLIHVHNMPDFLVYAAWPAKRAGAKVILDIHDVVPELFANKFGGTKESAWVKLMRLIEKRACAFADHVIISNHLWRETLLRRSVTDQKCSVFVNHVDPDVFSLKSRQRPADDGKIILLFPGTFQWHQGLDVAIDAMAFLKTELPQAELHLYGGGSPDTVEDLHKQIARLGLQDTVKFCGGVLLAEMPQLIANADIGVVPKRADTFGNEAYSTKIMEFMSQGIPSVVSRTKIDQYYFDESVVRFFTSGDSRALADGVLEIVRNPDLRRRLCEKSLQYADANSWGRKKFEYLHLVDSLTTEKFTGLPARAAQGQRDMLGASAGKPAPSAVVGAETPVVSAKSQG